MPFPLCHPGRTFVIFQNLLLSFFLPLLFSKTCVRSSGLQLLGHPIQSGRTESAFRETSCSPICWKAKSHRLFKFKNGTTNDNSNTEKSISTLWRNPTYCERKEDSLGLIIFFSECRMFPFFSFGFVRDYTSDSRNVFEYFQLQIIWRAVTVQNYTIFRCK